MKERDSLGDACSDWMRSLIDEAIYRNDRGEPMYEDLSRRLTKKHGVGAHSMTADNLKRWHSAKDPESPHKHRSVNRNDVPQLERLFAALIGRPPRDLCIHILAGTVTELELNPRGRSNDRSKFLNHLYVERPHWISIGPRRQQPEHAGPFAALARMSARVHESNVERFAGAIHSINYWVDSEAGLSDGFLPPNWDCQED